MTTDEELERIKQKKAMELMRIAMERKKRMEELKKAEEAPKTVTEEEKLMVMKYFLTPDAYDYWLKLYNNNEKRGTAETIFLNILYLIKIGSLEGRQVSRLGVKKLERKIEGIPPSITIKRKGEKERELS